MSWAVAVDFVATKCARFVRRSTITITALHLCSFVSGRLVMKSIVICFHRPSGIFSGCSKPGSFLRDVFVRMHISHVLQYERTALAIKGQ